MSDGLFCEDVLPIVWRVLDGRPPEHEVAHVNRANDALLRAFAGLEECPPRRDEQSDVAQELARIENKLDFFLDLVCDLLRRGVALPAPVSVRYSGTEVIWRPDIPPPLEALLALDLYLSSQVPRPLCLFARVEALTDDGEVRAGFEDMTADVREGLEKHVFRHHRRAVAQSRQSS